MKKEEYLSTLSESLSDILDRIDDQDTKANLEVFNMLGLSNKTYGQLCIDTATMPANIVNRLNFLNTFNELNYLRELSIDKNNSVLKIETTEHTVSFNYKLPKEFSDTDGVLLNTREKDVLFMLSVSAIAQANDDLIFTYPLSNDNLWSLMKFVDTLSENENVFELFYSNTWVDGVLFKDFSFGSNRVLLHERFGVTVVYCDNVDFFYKKLNISPENFYYLIQTFGDNKFILKALWLFDLISGYEYKFKEFYNDLISSKDFTDYLKKTKGIDLCNLEGLRDSIISLFNTEGVKKNSDIYSKLMELRNYQGDICETLCGDLTFALSVVSLYCANQDVDYDIAKFLTIRDEASNL